MYPLSFGMLNKKAINCNELIAFYLVCRQHRTR